MGAVRREFRSRRVGLRRRRPGVRWRCLPGRAAAARPARGRGMCPGHCSGGSARAGRTWRCSSRRPTRGGAGSARTRVPGGRLRLRVVPAPGCGPARPAVGTRRAAPTGRLAAGPAADQTTGRRGRPAGSALPVVAAGGVAVLPRPRATPGRSTGDRTSTSSPAVSADAWSPRTRRSGWTGSARN